MMGEEGVDNGVSETMGGLLEAFPLPLIHVSPAGACSCNKAMCELLDVQSLPEEGPLARMAGREWTGMSSLVRDLAGAGA
ncbi:MAG: hypothetical protein KDB87_04085, partial [Flavobacteriales bacterium]|nr:hypothetical protein [Flavobacteriales bacterium]